MASVTALHHDDGSQSVENFASLHASLVDVLRSEDECVVLPGARRTPNSGVFEGVVMSLDGAEANAPGVFKADWGAGVSVVRVGSELAEPLLSTPQTRKRAIQALTKAISNELAGDDDVGPALGSSTSKDAPSDDWKAGFDSSSCCCGLYSAIEQKSIVHGNPGMTRATRSYFLVCKAGSGRAGQEFHAKFMGAISNGTSLDEALLCGKMDRDGCILSEATIQRVNAAGRRNRARLILQAAEVLGLGPDVDSVPDHACSEQHKRPCAILMADCVTNTMTRRSAASSDGTEPSRWWYYSGAVAPAPISQGAILLSNAAQGMVLVLGDRDEDALRFRNEAHGSLPFGSPRTRDNKDAIKDAVTAHKRAARKADASGIADLTDAATDTPALCSGHPDEEWLSQRFGWKRNQAARALDVHPPQLWGTHQPLEYEKWAKQGGLSAFRRLMLVPELVVLAGAEAPLVRAAQ